MNNATNTMLIGLYWVLSLCRNCDFRISTMSCARITYLLNYWLTE